MRKLLLQLEKKQDSMLWMCVYSFYVDILLFLLNMCVELEMIGHVVILYFPFYFLPHLFLLLNDNGQSFFRKILTNRTHFVVINFFFNHTYLIVLLDCKILGVRTIIPNV